MAAKKLPQQFPAMVIKPFADIVDAYKKVRDFARIIEELRRQQIEVVNDHADLIDTNDTRLDSLEDNDSWHNVGDPGEPAFQNSWVNFGSTWQVARFRKFSDGRVEVQGLIKDGTVSATTPAFTLPTGYRPGANLLFKPSTNTATVNARLDVLSDGDVRPHTGGNTWFSINCSFYADQ